MGSHQQALYMAKGILVLNYTTADSYETYTVPSGYSSLTAKVWGAGGDGAGGGAITGTISVTSGDVIHVRPGSLEHGSALKVVRSGSIIGTLLAGAGGGSGDTNTGGAGGGLNGAGNGGGTGATRSAAGTGANNGGGPYDFTTFGSVSNGGARPPEDNGSSGGPGGGGYYGGGSGESSGPSNSTGGGGGSGYDSGFSSVTTYAGGNGTSGAAGNSSDPDKPASRGAVNQTGAIVLLLS